jgi:hypothetical protein
MGYFQLEVVTWKTWPLALRHALCTDSPDQLTSMPDPVT